MASLWVEATRMLGDKEKTWLETSTDIELTRLEDVESIVVRKRQEYLDSRLKVKTTSGKTFFVRDVLDGIVIWLNKFKQIGDVAIQIDPVHAAPAWAIVRFLLQAVVGDAQNFAAVAEGVEAALREVSRCAAIEGCMLGPEVSMTEVRLKLRAALVHFYTSFLLYLIHAAKYYATSTIKRVSTAIIRPVPALERELKDLHDRAMTVQVFLNDSVAELTMTQDHRIKKMLDMLTVYDQRLSLSSDAFETMKQQNARNSNIEFLNWISSDCYWRPHENSLKDLAPDTALWLEQTSQYKNFAESSEPGIFWLRGGPGFGKTKLMSVSIQNALEARQHVATSPIIAYFYASNMEYESSQSRSEQVLLSLTRQTLLACPERLGTLEQNYHAKRNEAAKEGLDVKHISSQEAVQYLTESADEEPIIFIIDGLDEMFGDANTLLNDLRYVMTKAHKVVKVIIASRPMLTIDLVDDKVVIYDIGPEDCIEDIERYLKNATAQAIEGKQLLRGDVSAPLQRHIIKEISCHANGMFLWAKLQLTNFCTSGKFKVAEDVISHLSKPPRTLTAMYDAMYMAVTDCESTASNILHHTFAWLLASQRPLSIYELLIALETTASIRMRRKLSLNDVLDICGNFVVFHEESSKVTFVHVSAREYLGNRPEHSDSLTNAIIFHRCMQCYRPTTDTDGESFSDKDNVDSTDHERVQLEYIEHYASLFWPFHYKQISEQYTQREAFQVLLDFTLSGHGTFFKSWHEDTEEFIHDLSELDNRRSILSACLSPHKSPIYMASMFGFDELLGHILEPFGKMEKAEQVNKTNSQGATPVYLSARSGNSLTLRRLILCGAALNPVGGYFGSPLQAAAFFGHIEAAKLLLDEGADPAQPGKFPDVFRAAFAGGHEHIVHILITKRLDGIISVEDILHNSTRLGFDLVIQELLSQCHLESVIAKDDALINLQIALQYGNQKAARKWLLHVPSINTSGGPYGNALQAAVCGGYWQSVELVVGQGADLSLKGRYGPPLRAAALMNRRKVLSMLLQKGARDSGKHRNHCALEAAASKGFVGIIKLLTMPQYPTVDAKKAYSAALEAASLQGSAEICALLLDWYGTVKFSIDEDTALKVAVFNSRQDIIGLFFSRFEKLEAISWAKLCLQSIGKGPSLLVSMEDQTQFEDYESEFSKNDRASISQSRRDFYDTPMDLGEFDAKFAELLGVTQNEVVNSHDEGDLMRFAAKVGDTHVIEGLIHRGISSNASEDRNTFAPRARPIEIAAAYGNVEAIRMFLRHKVDVQRTLVFAVRFRRKDVIVAVLEELPECALDLPDFRDNYDKAYEPDKWFINYGNKRFRLSDDSALAMAIEVDYYDAFKMLLDHRKTQEDYELTFVHLKAARDDRLTYLSEIIELHKAKIQSLVAYEESTTVSEVKQWREGPNNTGCSPDPEDSSRNKLNRYTSIAYFALIEAASSANTKALRLLLDSYQDRFNQTDLSQAIIEAVTTFNPKQIEQVVEGYTTEEAQFRKLYRIALVCALRPDDNPWLPRRRQLINRVIPDLFTRVMTMVDLSNEEDQKYVATMISKTVGRRLLAVAHSILQKVSYSHRIMRHEPSILAVLIENALTSNHKQHPHLQQLTEALITHGAPIENARKHSSLSPLGQACLWGVSYIFFALVDAGADISTIEPIPESIRRERHTIISLKEYDTSMNLMNLTILGLHVGDLSQNLTHPISSRFGDIIYFLYHQGIVPDIFHEKFKTLCQLASFQGNMDYIRSLIHMVISCHPQREGFDLLNELDLLGLLPAAAYGGQIALVDHLLELGLSLHSSPTFEHSWAHQDFIIPSTAVKAATLFGQGAYNDPDRPSQRERKPDQGLIERKTSILRRFQRLGINDAERFDVFQFAAVYGEVEMTVDMLHPALTNVDKRAMQYCIENIIDHGRVDSIDAIMGSTKLVSESFQQIFAKVCVERADVQMFMVAGFGESIVNRAYIQKVTGCKDRNERTNILSRTLLNQNRSVDDVQALINLGAETKLSQLPVTAIGYLAYSSSLRDQDELLAILSILTSNGHQVNDTVPAYINKNKVFDTPLHVAVRVGAQRSFLEKLLELGAYMDADGGFGTPLFHARSFENEPAIQLLVEKEAQDKVGQYDLVQLARIGWFKPSIGWAMEECDSRCEINEGEGATKEIFTTVKAKKTYNYERPFCCIEGVHLDDMPVDWTL